MAAKESAISGAPKKKKRRKRKRLADEATAKAPSAGGAEPAEGTELDAQGRELDADGRERAHFLLSFPKHPELDKLVAAYEAGNYALVREQAPRLAKRADDPAVRDAALELRRRIDPDPLAKYLLLAGVLLLVFLTLYAYLGNRQ